MEVLALLDKLEALINSSGLRLGKKAMVDSDRVLELVDQIRLALPKTVQEAQDLLVRREGVINTALLEARRIKASSEEEARRMVEQSQVVREAQQKAEEIVANGRKQASTLIQEAERKAHQLMQEADVFAQQRYTESTKYAQQLLLQLEENLSTLLNTVRRGLDAIQVEPRPHAPKEHARAR